MSTDVPTVSGWLPLQGRRGRNDEVTGALHVILKLHQHSNELASSTTALDTSTLQNECKVDEVRMLDYPNVLKMAFPYFTLLLEMCLYGRVAYKD